MSTSRPFAYNTGTGITGTVQIGSLAIGYPTAEFESTGLEWWNGPDEEVGYVIAQPVPDDSQSTPLSPITASIEFYRSDNLSESEFVALSNFVAGLTGGGPFVSGDSAKTWLNNNGYWTSYVVSTTTTSTSTTTTTTLAPTTSTTTTTIAPTTTSTTTTTSTSTTTTTTIAPIVTTGLIMDWDIQNSSSYSGTGTTITDLEGNINGTMTGTIGYTSGSPKYLTIDGGVS